MATVIGVGMQMTANAAGMTKGLTEAEKALQLLQKMVDQNQEALTRFGAQADATSASVEKLSDTTGFLATIEVGRVLADVAQSIANAFSQVASNVTGVVGPISAALDSLNDLSARTGINVETLQGYSLAAKMAGVDTAAFGKAVQALTLNIGKAAPGDALDKSLKSLNLSVQQLRALAPEQQFSAIGEAISRLPTAADRAAAAVQLFGKQGAALAPLFREGAASLEELRARADRLGIIVNETQINNVAEMNDAFDLVRATIEGIIGQVIGNLAPAVTAVTEEFLRFVEEWSSTAGQGGTGIANAITGVLLEGATYFAGVFDGFVKSFKELVQSVTQAGDVLGVVGKLIFSAAESLRVVFNVFEIAGNALVVGFAKILEGLGSWVDKDLQLYGKQLAAVGDKAAQKNAAEMEAAATNAAEAFNSIFNGGEGNAKQSGKGAAQQFVKGLQEELRAQRAPEFKVATNIKQTRERLNAFLADAGDGAAKFLQESVKTLDVFEQQVKEGGLVAAQIKIMNGFSERLNQQLDIELRARQASVEAAQRQSEADAKRVDELLKQKEKATQLEDDIRTVIRAQAEAEQLIAEARARASQEEATAAAARLAELDQLRAKLEDTQQAIDQGFANGFAAAFAKTAEGISGLVKKAAEFGNAGAQAAATLQQGISKAQEQARAGIITQDVYEREIANQRMLFDQRLAQIEQLRKKEQENQNAIFQQKVDANQRVQQFLQQQLGEQAKAEVVAAKEVAARKLEAAVNVQAIENQIGLEKQALEAARQQGDMQAAKAGVERLNQLNKALAVEEKIANGKDRQIIRQRQAAEEQQKFAMQQQEAATRQQEEAAKAQQEREKAILQEQQRIAEENRKAQEAEFVRQQERIAKLNTLGDQQVNTADIRTREGAALVVDLAAAAQDPALIQARMQTKTLQQILTAVSNYFAANTNSPLTIVGF